MARAKHDSARASKKKKARLAGRCDPYVLYEQSVQDVETEVEFLEMTFKGVRGRAPRMLREDFAGTAKLACEWVRRNRLHQAAAVDIDPLVLDWGRSHNVAALPPRARARVQLLQADVRSAGTPPADIITAFNFSYWTFKTRALMLEYFSAARSALSEDGLLMLDMFGGSDAFTVCKERTRHKGFTYIWEQADYDPISGYMSCFIHFKFPDGSKLKRAFSYEWRLWTLPEIRELLAEAGFARVDVYWEGTDEDGEGNGEYLPAERGEADPAWIAFIIAQR